MFLRPSEETRIPRNLPPPRRLLPQEERLLSPRNPQPLRRTQRKHPRRRLKTPNPRKAREDQHDPLVHLGRTRRIKPTPRKAKKRNVGRVNRCLPPWKSRSHKLQNASRIPLPNPANGMDHAVVTNTITRGVVHASLLLRKAILLLLLL